MSKIESYLGLCRKANQIVIGQDNLKKFSKAIYLLVVSNSSSNNLCDLANRLANKFNCNLIKPNIPLEDIIHISGCKIVGVRSKSLADTIINNTNEYEILRSRNGE